jgi:anti-sigma factor RsiW
MTELDFEQLSAYIDDEMSFGERTALEARLATDTQLRQELASLRVLVQALSAMPDLKAPRDFTLSPTMLEPSRNQIAADVGGLPPLTLLPMPNIPPQATVRVLRPRPTTWLSVAAAVFVMIIGAGVLFTQVNRQSNEATGAVVANVASPTVLPATLADAEMGNDDASGNAGGEQPIDGAMARTEATTTPVLDNVAIGVASPSLETSSTGANLAFESSNADVVPQNPPVQQTTQAENALEENADVAMFSAPASQEIAPTSAPSDLFSDSVANTAMMIEETVEAQTEAMMGGLPSSVMSAKSNEIVGQTLWVALAQVLWVVFNNLFRFGG